MKVQYYTASTLDGYIADENDGLEWLFQFQESPTDDYAEFFKDVGALVMGSSTFQWMLDNVPPKDWPYTQPTWVFTHRDFPVIENREIYFVRDDVLPVFDHIKSRIGGKNIWLVGGGDLVGQFYDAGLLDEIIVTIASVTLGAGKPLLPRAVVTPPMQLTSVHQYGTAFVQLRYDVK